MANGGPFDCYPPGYPVYPQPPTVARQWPDSITLHPSVAEQMGIDPISKLAAAIEKLADALTDYAT